MNKNTAKIIADKDFNKLLSSDYSEEELDFLSVTRTIDDFAIGLKVPGKLLPKTIPGGVVLEDVPYEMRESFRC